MHGIRIPRGGALRWPRSSLRFRFSWSLAFSLALCVAMSLAFTGCGTTKKDNRSAEQMYNDAMEDFNSSSWESAGKQFEQIQSRYPFGRIAQQSQINQAYCQYKGGDTEQALANIDRFLKQYPDHPSVDYMLYLRGLTNFNDKLGFFNFLSQQDPSERDPKALRDSYDAFRELLDRFPDSKYAEDGRLRSAWLVNALSSYEVHVARYYYRRGAWTAAVNRSQNALKTYPGATASEEALGIMIAAYNKLGLDSLRDDTRRIMALNYPDSRFNDEAQIIEPVKSWWKVW